MADPVIMTANERWKSLSRTAFQLGAVLISAATVKTYGDSSFSLEVAVWFAVAFALMFVGWKVLTLLESES